MNLDSLPRILEFLRCLSIEQFLVHNYKVESTWVFTSPEKLLISDSFFRSYTCPPSCGGCCKPVSLLYFEHNIKELLDKHPELKDDILVRTININNKDKIYYELKNYNNRFCRFLCPHDKRCTIHDAHPLLCRFELKRFLHYKDKVVLTKKLPGRGWMFGAQCKMIPFQKEAFGQDISELLELKSIAENFQIKHKIDTVIDELISKGRGYDID